MLPEPEIIDTNEIIDDITDDTTNTNFNSSSESFVNQVTLQYLMNKSQYSNYLEKKTYESFSKRERKFYSQRFTKLSKKLLFKRKSVEDMPTDIKFAFENYLKSCIHHFKMTDHTDSVQAEYYKEEEEEEGLEGEEDYKEEENVDEIEGLIEEENIELKVEEVEEVEHLEEEEEKCIKKKEKRNNGKLRKKKNIDNIYEDNKIE